jgi:formyltetrahydrofolate synthetase
MSKNYSNMEKKVDIINAKCDKILEYMCMIQKYSIGARGNNHKAIEVMSEANQRMMELHKEYKEILDIDAKFEGIV